MAVLVIGEYEGTKFSYSTGRAIKAATELQLPIDFLVIGAFKNAPQDVKKMSPDFIRQIFFLPTHGLKEGLVEPIAKIVVPLMNEYTHLFMASTSFGKSLAPRIASKLDVAQISDITRVINARTYERPIYAGNALQIVQSNYKKLVVTVRTSAFPGNLFYSQNSASRSITPINTKEEDIDERLSYLIERRNTVHDRPDLRSADIIISGGLGLGSKEKFEEMIYPLADILHAAVAGTRGAVDAGYISNDFQIGQTGKVVAPLLYIAIGISGAAQHLAGIQDSKIIVAINKDIDAPIFKFANYGIVGDLFFVVPKLSKLLLSLVKKS